jgi:Helitron helicase-like domain at N-terminus
MQHFDNAKERKMMFGQASIFMLHHPNESDMSLDEMRELASDPERCREQIGKMQQYAGNVRGTDGYFRARREELQHAVQQLGPLHLFLTFSQADNHWEADNHRSGLGAVPTDGAVARRSNVSRLPNTALLSLDSARERASSVNTLSWFWVPTILLAIGLPQSKIVHTVQYIQQVMHASGANFQS